ncbi:MAG: ferritin-like domain-containing protein [Chloroflexota bacterium]
MRPRDCPPRDRHWRIDDIPYASIERARVAGNRELFYLLASASFVEITSDLYTRNLVDYFHDDGEVREWIEHQWQHEELQHGAALKCYVNCLRPNFDWERAYLHFYSEYSPRCATKPLGPTPALEMVSRCLVETGTASLYTMLGRISAEPVLQILTRCIKDDEVRHYKYFYRYFLRYQQRERVVQSALLRTLWSRISEINGEDAYLAFKHVFLECHPDGRFNDSDYKAYCRQWKMLARSYYPYEMAIQMLLKPLQLNRWIQPATASLLAAGAKHFI